MKVAQVRRYALSLPDATEEPHFEYFSFRVGRPLSPYGTEWCPTILIEEKIGVKT
jgi:hypothetical protein